MRRWIVIAMVFGVCQADDTPEAQSIPALSADTPTIRLPEKERLQERHELDCMMGRRREEKTRTRHAPPLTKGVPALTVALACILAFVAMLILRP